jgi:hypothetical protein
MDLSNFNVRGIAPEVMAHLKREAKKQHTSINALILEFIEQGMGYSHKGKRTRYHELDSLAGTWSVEDSTLFDEKTNLFEKIDEELWS